MLSEIFYWVVNMSILGSLAGLIVLLLRRVRALPRFGIYLFWLLPLLRLWVPFGLASRYSLLSFLSRFTTKTVIIWEENPAYSMSNFIMGAEKYFPMEYKTDLLKDLFTVAGTVWVIVAAAAVLSSVLLYIFTKSALKNSTHVKGNLYRSDKILSPAVYGIFRPRIILPLDIPEEEIEYILAHERVHIRRRDNLWRVVAVITACVHWFNPLAWVFLKFFFTDMELACDAGVLKGLSGGEKKEYAAALLSCAGSKTYYASAFGGAKTRLRIDNILSYKKLTVLSGVCFALLFAFIAVTVITNAIGG